ncbi:basic amino acid/polyamine antiporter [Laceyella sacchari]|uniref:Basic amino acid/polyamine antiporter n=1 Tax=Laceyella sacchari TaxID=37482 RepID=A0ABY5U0F0_LACSH|nr:basic amino acid/polyamine antiporter [Laceyella sacchari]UWE03099.1 basic amino acid/polyamine antiporter [Laceyella sacchari]
MKQKQLGLFSLMAAVVGTIVGGAAFNLPSDMAAAAGSGPVILAWVITGLGMLALAMVFRNLSSRKPELSGGIYSYARAGFGPFIGFSSAWGYWIASILGIVAFVTLFFQTLRFFSPLFGQGDNLPSLVGGIAFVLFFHWLVARGIKEAAIINIMTTVAKLIPILIFLIIVAAAFKRDVFMADLWGPGSFSWQSVSQQVKDTMLVTLWAFVGIEGAIVLSGRAKRAKDVGVATIVGLLGTLAIYLLISVLSTGILSQAELAALPEPSMAYVLKAIVGPWGAVLIVIGLLISISGGMLSWYLVTVEIPYVAAQDGVFPDRFAQVNRQGTPMVSLWWSTGITLLFTGLVYVSASTYQKVYSMASVAILIPYLLSALYQVKLALVGETYLKDGRRTRDLLIGALATGYSLWTLYAAGLTYLLMVSVVYAVGMVLYLWVRRGQEQSMRKWDWIVAGIIVMAALVALGGGMV